MVLVNSKREWGGKKVYVFLNSYCPKVNLIDRLEIKLTYSNVEDQRANNYIYICVCVCVCVCVLWDRYLPIHGLFQILY